MPELDHRHRREPELPRRQHPAVTGDDAVRAVDQHRIGPAELADRAGDQRHLRLGMGAGVPGVGDQVADRAVADPQIVGSLDSAAAVHVCLRGPGWGIARGLQAV